MSTSTCMAPISRSVDAYHMNGDVESVGSMFEPTSRSGSSSLSDSSEAILPRDMVSAFRKSAPKARTGCVTCKIRRVKCDEEKPECKRCCSTGRKCDGYAPPKPIKRKKRQPKSQKTTEATQYEPVAIHQAPVIRKSPSVDIQGDLSERRSFHYFRSQKFTQLPGNFEPYFWNSIMLQFSHSYPTVQQSLVALSAIYESRSEDKGGLNRWQRREHALQQYNKAVKTLVGYMSSNDQDPRVALISCLIFVWVELLQKNIEAGFQHLYSGMRILTSLRESGTLQKKDSNEVERDDIYGSLSRSFTRLRIQVSIHGSTTDELAASCPLTDDTRYLPIPHTFSSIFESRICLDANFKIIFGYFRRLLVQHGADWENSPLSAVMLGYTRQEHLQRLKQWHTATKRMMEQSKDVEKEALGYAYLQVYYTLVKICGEVLFENEMVYDRYDAEFEKMLELSEVLLRNTREHALPLSFDMGVIPPLFFSAIKCRVFSLRMRALELLRLAPEQEGLWIRDSMVRFCEWKIPQEEAGRGNLPPTEPLPESARIYRERLSLAEDGSRTCIKYRSGPYMVDGRISEELIGYMEPLEWVGNMM